MSTSREQLLARRYALALLTFVYALNFVDRQLLAILQESIKADLALSDQQLGLMTGFAFALFYVVAGLPIASFADRGNRRNVVALATGVWSLMTALCGAAQTFTQLLLARIGVGIGEAGGSPPSHSIISDLFPAHQRGGALAVYSTGVNFGILFGFLFGGWLNEFFGWRVAFLVVGAPGVLVALVVRLTLKEPARSASVGAPVPFARVLRRLAGSMAFRHLALGAALNALAGYASASWTASFLMRSHGMESGEAGTWLALVMGVGGALGVVLGGVGADRLTRRDSRWRMWLPAITGLVCVPFLVGAYWTSAQTSALALSVVPGILFNVYLGNALATTHGLVDSRMRAVASAVFFLILNLLGLGLGPWLVGALSDALRNDFGEHSLRWSMLLTIPPAMLWSAAHFFLAARRLPQELEASVASKEGRP